MWLKHLSPWILIKNEVDVVYTTVARQKYAYVIYDLDYKKNIGIVKEFCAKRGIGLVGVCRI